MNKLEEIKKEIAQVIAQSPIEEDPTHSINTWEWLLKLKPDADEALQIAALAHDIERAITGNSDSNGIKDISDQEVYRKHKLEHSIRSANFIAEIMKKFGYDIKSILRVKHLVEHHELGGDPESDILMNADSISYFDNNVSFYFKKNGPKKTKDKVRFMFQRTSNPEVKKIILSLKHKSPEVEKIFKEAASE